MRLRQPHQDAILPAADASRMRQVLTACSQLLAWAEAACGPQFAAAAQAAGFSRAPGALRERPAPRPDGPAEGRAVESRDRAHPPRPIRRRSNTPANSGP